MFAFFNRSRRHVAVLAALAMLASVLVAAPAVAADDIHGAETLRLLSAPARVCLSRDTLMFRRACQRWRH